MDKEKQYQQAMLLMKYAEFRRQGQNIESFLKETGLSPASDMWEESVRALEYAEQLPVQHILQQSKTMLEELGNYSDAPQKVSEIRKKITDMEQSIPISDDEQMQTAVTKKKSGIVISLLILCAAGIAGGVILASDRNPASSLNDSVQVTEASAEIIPVTEMQTETVPPAYEYPRTADGYSQRIIKDTGKLQNVYLNLSEEKLLKQIGIEDTDSFSDSSDSVYQYQFLLKGDVTSFPFSGESGILGVSDAFGESSGEYSALFICYFYQNSCEYASYTLAVNDMEDARNMMQELYQKYDNGSGQNDGNACMIPDVQAFGGTLYMKCGENKNGTPCFFFKIYNTLDTETETEPRAGEIQIADYAGKEFATYGYDDKITAKGILSSVKAEQEKYSVKVTVEGEKTYDAYGENTGSMLKFCARLIDTDGLVVETKDFYSPSVAAGEKFKTSFSFSSLSADKSSDYILEITDEKNTSGNAANASGSISFQTETENEGISFALDSTDGFIERFNGYTGELQYSFRIDEVVLQETAALELSNLHLTFSGEKLYDHYGEDAERRLCLVVSLKDEEGTVINSTNIYTPSALKTGDTFEALTADFWFLELEPGNYTVDIHAQPNTYVIPVTENTEYLNPEKWYTTSEITNYLESGSEFPFDASARWVDEYAMHEIYVDDNLMLHGISSEPYDLHNTESGSTEHKADSSFSDAYYGDMQYYVIPNPADLLKDTVPAEAIPDTIYVSVAHQGDLLFGERDGLYVFFRYKHQPEDESNYIALGFESHKGNELEQEEWDNVISRAEELGTDLSALAVR